jgi:hypothetical protein
MRKQIFIVIFSILAVHNVKGQIISQFTWDSGGAVTVADIGPDGISVSGSAISDVGGVGGTNGLNAGLPKRNISLEIPGSPTFDIDGIDVSFDYQREESIGNFLERGSSLIIRGCAQLSVSFRVDDGAGGFNTVNSGNVYAIPNDDTFRNYRFTYRPLTGEAELSVDGTSVWTNDGPDNRNLYWTGAGNLFIGNGMDGTGFNNTFLDNFIIGNIFDSLLPIELLFFTAEEQNGTQVECTWATASERNNAYFEIEKSLDGFNWELVGEVAGANDSNVEINYSFIDDSPNYGISYYRLKQIDFDGEFEYTKAVSVVFSGIHQGEILAYPNPTNQNLNIRGVNSISDIQIFDMTGRELHISTLKVSSNAYGQIIDVSSLALGTYIIRAKNQTFSFVRN